MTALKDKSTAIRIGGKIRDARNARGWTQAQFAKKIGKLQSQVSEWETGYCEPQLDTLLVIAAKLRVEIGDILCR